MKQQLLIIKWGILALFFVSGAPALLYQIIWQHHLYTIYGAHAESVAIIVGAFMFGLGIGSLVGGEVSARFKRSPFYLFAIVECLIGVFGYFSLELFDAVGRATTQLGVFGAGATAFALILVPTIAMGATLPILANALIERLHNVGVSVGNLYFVNTLGSACAAFGSIFLFNYGFGQHGVILFAVGLNGVVVVASLLLRVVSDRKGETKDSAERVPEALPVTEESAKGSRMFAALLSFSSGFLALSVEIIWFRVVFLFTSGRAFAFPIALAFFLFGIAFGSFYAARHMRKVQGDAAVMIRRMAAHIMLLSGVILSGIFFCVGGIVTSGAGPFLFLLTTLLAFPLGVLFPLLMHAGVLPNKSAGKSVSYIYAANILGSTIGSLGTGFILLEYVSLRGIVFILSGLSVVLALALCARPWNKRVMLGALIAALVMGVSYNANASLYEKLQMQTTYDGSRFAHVVENRSGVVAVTEDKIVYGTGVYDGRYSTDLENDRNIIIRPYSLSAFHANPKRILIIGLSSGSWAQVVANLPSNPEVDILEINPGHLKLIPQYPAVASLMQNPRVHITILDGRRYLTRNPDKKYDAIIMNTSYYWRAGATNLLSREFLNLLRAHLNEKGVVMYNTTGSAIVFKTGLSTFNYGWRIANALLVSDSPLPIDRDRLLKNLTIYKIDGKPVLDSTTASGTATFAKLKEEFDPAQTFSSTTLLEEKDGLLGRLVGVPILTDDNMLVEWSQEQH